MSAIESIDLWHKRARPNPTTEDLNVQLGCHFEEIVEMLQALRFVLATEDEAKVRKAFQGLESLATLLKNGRASVIISDRKEFLDSIADQVVTGIGIAHCAHMDGRTAVVRVNQSNWSKFSDEGEPIFDENGKIKKGPRYEPPNLEGLY